MAERYVKLVLALGQHDADYVDAYYGPPEWKADVERRKAALTTIDKDAEQQLGELARLNPIGDELVMLRHQYVRRQLEALRARVRMLSGGKAELRRGVAGALRCRCAHAPRVLLPGLS